MSRLYVEWHFAEHKDLIWAGIPSRDGKRMLYSVPVCETFSSEHNGRDIIAGGRFLHYVPEHQKYRVDLDRGELHERWPTREENFYQMGKMIEWAADNCREKPWCVEASANLMKETVGMHFSFADDVAAIAFKFVWQ